MGPYLDAVFHVLYIFHLLEEAGSFYISRVKTTSLLVNLTAKMTDAMTVAARHHASKTTKMLHRRGHRIVVTLRSCLAKVA